MRVSAKATAGVIALAGGVVLLRPGTRASQAARHQVHIVGRRLRHFSGWLHGLSYRLRGRRPDPNITDEVLADRIRSSLGGIEKRLDLPRVHVMVEDHVALLHGAVGTAGEADEIERMVRAVSGVVGIESYLHVGLGGGDTRPSTGRAMSQPSDARTRLIDAATAAGADPAVAVPLVRAILATFADRLPRGERDQVAAHLPADVRELFTPPRRTHPAAPPRTVHELVARIAAATSELPDQSATQVTSAVLQALRSLVPQEQADVAAVLPPELRELWQPGASNEPQHA